MRGGKVVGRDLYRTESLKDEAEVLPEFLIAYYTDPKQIPPHIFVCAGQEYELAEQWFADKLGVKVTITAIPLDGQKHHHAADTAVASVPGKTAVSVAAEKTPVYAADTTDLPDTADAATVDNKDLPDVPERIVKVTDNTASGGITSLNTARTATAAMSPAILRRHKAALAMAQFNAKEDASRRIKELGDFPALEELQKILSLDRPPHRIEGFDIAHLHGKYTVASLISFKDGNPDKKNYRIFRLRTTDGIIDDYASMREAVARRYTRLLNEAAELPDLIMIDGGIGQVNAAKAVLDALELDIPLVGLAEKNEELYRPHINKPIVLPRRSAALRVLQRVRDETHRFANTRNNRLRSKEELHLRFEQLPHIGEKRAARLLRSFSSIEKLTAASPEAAAAAAGITQAQAEEVIGAARKATAHTDL